MGKIHLTPRLRALAALVPDGAVLADIGTDIITNGVLNASDDFCD